jgi:hypothetical protein
MYCPGRRGFGIFPEQAAINLLIGPLRETFMKGNPGTVHQTMGVAMDNQLPGHALLAPAMLIGPDMHQLVQQIVDPGIVVVDRIFDDIDHVIFRICVGCLYPVAQQRVVVGIFDRDFFLEAIVPSEAVEQPDNTSRLNC